MKIIEAIQDTVFLHKGQVRKYSGRPYHEHSIRVFTNVINLPEFKELSSHVQETVSIGSIGHDWLEDTKATPDWIRTKYGQDVLDLILDLTNIYTTHSYPTLNRHKRKAMEFSRLARVSEWAKRIKIEDRLDNLGEMDYHGDAKFVDIYMDESFKLAKAVDINNKLYDKILFYQGIFQTVKGQ